MDIRKEKAIAITHDFLQSGGELPFSNEIGPQLLSVSSQPVEKIDVDKLVQLIQLDPGLASSVLQIANSVYFSGAGKVVSLRRAIVQIGLEEAVNFIHVVFYRKSLPECPEIKGFLSDKDYWNHSWACAVACKSLGHPAIDSNVLPGELYIAGLLHGIGKLILAIHRPVEFSRCLENSVDFQQSLAESQLDLLGTTDADIAAELLKVWQLPDTISMAIKYYQRPAEAIKEYQEFAGLLQLAYFIANTSGIGNMKDELSFNVNETWITQQPKFSLYDDEFRYGFLKNIYSLLEKKRTSVEAVGEKDTESCNKKDIGLGQSEKAAVTESLLRRLGRWLMVHLR